MIRVKATPDLVWYFSTTTLLQRKLTLCSSSLSDCISVPELFPTFEMKGEGLGRVEVGALFEVIALPAELSQTFSVSFSWRQHSLYLTRLSIAELAFFCVRHLCKRCFFCFFTASLEGQNRLTENHNAHSTLLPLLWGFLSRDSPPMEWEGPLRLSCHINHQTQERQKCESLAITSFTCYSVYLDHTNRQIIFASRILHECLHCFISTLSTEHGCQSNRLTEVSVME